MRELIGKLLEGPEPEWKKKPVTFPSTQHTGRGATTHTAVNWPKVGDGPPVDGRIERIYDAWLKADKYDITKYVSWDDLSKATGLSVENIASEVKFLQKRHPELVGLTVDRMGNNVYVKFKGKPVHD